MSRFQQFPTSTGGLAVVFGASGGIGAALCARILQSGQYAHLMTFSRRGALKFDLTDECSIEAAATTMEASGLQPRLLIDATGVLHDDGCMAEKALRQLNPGAMAQAFAINAIGPALLMKHLLPRLPRSGRSVFATLSAKVGSIGDNRLGGWISYRASKAALNQIVRTAAIELRRSHPEAVCVALHPGTVDTALSQPFARSGLTVQPPENCAEKLLRLLDTLGPEHSGTFIDADGSRLPW